MTEEDLTRRIQLNADQIASQYQYTKDLLNTAAMEAFPWVINLPGVRNGIPSMFPEALRGRIPQLLPRGVPPSVDKIERLVTQLYAVLVASYRHQEKQKAQEA